MGVPSPCGHSCMVCATVCLTAMPSFSDISDFQQSAKFQGRQKLHPLFFHVAQYGDDIIGYLLNFDESCPVGSES